MRLKLTLRRSEDRSTNLLVAAEATTAIGDVATALFAGDPENVGREVPDDLTLEVVDSAGHGEGASRVLDSTIDLISAGLRSGTKVSLVRRSAQYVRPGEGRGPAVATLHVLGGPDAGREFPLPAGTTYLGRDRDMDVRLTDPLVSKRHARITVTDGVEIADLGSANGMLLGGARVVRAALGAGDEVTLGDSVLAVSLLRRASTHAAPTAPVVEFNRSPRVVPRVPELELQAPTPPERPAIGRLPLLALLAPLLMGAILWYFTQQLLSIVFVALSPLLMLGTWLDQRSQSRRLFRAQKEQFESAVAAMDHEVDRAHDVERAIRLAAHPSLADVVDAAARLGPLLWTRRPEHSEFLTLRLGIGDASSGCRVRMPSGNNTLPEHWTRLTELEARAKRLDGVPVVADLRSSGSVGVACGGSGGRAVARGLVMQAIGLHAPGELVVAAFTSPVSRESWSWLEWLPHVGSPSSPLGGPHLADNAGTATPLLQSLEELVESRLDHDRKGRAARRGPIGPSRESASEDAPMPGVLVVVEDDAPASRARLVRLAERGPDAGVHILWVAAQVTGLPGACRTFVVVGEDGAATGEVRSGELRHPVAVEGVEATRAVEVARRLAAVVDAGEMAEDQSDLPRSVAFPSLVGLGLLDESAAVVERWRQTGSVASRGGVVAGEPRRLDASLHALVGQAGAAPLALDLRTHGPHALVGGTTGSGKSEFLQSWVLSIATTHSPDRVTFLFVDYKGGAAFADCIDLPHSVGLVTDLSPHLVRRALTSLRAELKHREHLLNRKKAKDLVSLERSGDPDAPPSLVIVVDEFAALATEVPEFVDGVVDVAQRGRSLGLHLILATQRPAGVIKDNLRANTNLRVALRMADEEDSTDILGVPVAAHFDPAIPGRGAVKTGPGRVTPFQTAYAGGWTTAEPERPRIEIAELGFGTSVEWDVPRPAIGPVNDQGPTDISRVVRTVARASRELEIPVPRRPWLPELATTYDFALLPNPRTDDQLILGVMDDPATQSQPVLVYRPDRDGNMAIYGTGGAGKSAALRALAVASAVTPRGGPVHVYGLDFGAKGLRALEALPHVGAIVDGDDDEGVGRVIRLVRDVVEDRAKRFAAVRAGSIGEYRDRAGAPGEPRILLLVDGVAAFRDAYEFASNQIFSTFAQIAVDGRPLGVHVVVTGDRPNAVPTSISSTVQKRLVLRMAQEDDYLLLGAAKDVLSAASPPGRGVLDGNEVQVAVLGGSSNLAVQSRELSTLAGAMSRHGVVRAASVGRLGSHIAMSSLVVSDVAGRPSIGVDDESLKEVGVEPRGPFLISGPPGSGRTTALLTIAAAVRRERPGVTTVHITARRSALVNHRVFGSSLVGAERIAEAAGELADLVESGRVPGGQLMVVIEALAELCGTAAEYVVDRLVKECIRADHMVVAESESSTWSQAYALAPPFKAGRRGLLLVPGDMEGDTLLGTGLGRFKRADFPPGRGFLVEGGRARKIQVAMPD